MSGKSLDQERAEYAWKCVQRQHDDYKNLAKGLPALIMGNGLMQAMAFLKAKGNGKDHYMTLGAQVYAWAVEGQRQEPPGNGSGFGDFKKMSKMTSSNYRRATEEALEILKWIRQLADAVIGDGGGYGTR